MAPEDVKNKKRKGATESAPKPKKQKKADEAASSKKASAKALSAAVQPLDDMDVKVKAPRKKAIDFWEEDGTAKDDGAAQKDKKKSKASKGKAVEEIAAEVTVEEPVAKSKKSKKTKEVDEPVETVKVTKKAKATKKKEPSPELQEDSEDSEAEDEDDQTAALLAGFESDRDESDAEEGGVALEVPTSIPEQAQQALAAASKSDGSDEPGVIFVGRIPHGFYEPQMKAYFKQFGKVNQLRLSRSKKTGASKHYAFVEFASKEVADIVARTMNNYLMFGHILQCKLVPAEQVHPNLFLGSKGRFKRMPRNKMNGAQMARGAEREVWEKRVQKETKRRSLKNKALKEQLGYEFVAPQVKAVAGVPKKARTSTDAAAQQLLMEAPAGEITLVDEKTSPDGTTITETTKVTKAKKGKKGKQEVVTETEVEVAPAVEEVAEPTPEKKRKSKPAAAAQETGRPKRTRKATA